MNTDATFEEFLNSTPDPDFTEEGWLAKCTGRRGEAFFESWVEHIASDNGWNFYHTWRSDRSQKGYPDLHLIKDTSQIYAELKTVKGKATTEQKEWLYDLDKVPTNEVYLWRPNDWRQIKEILSNA